MFVNMLHILFNSNNQVTLGTFVLLSLNTHALKPVGVCVKE